jgi:hypothetical protein
MAVLHKEHMNDLKQIIEQSNQQMLHGLNAMMSNFMALPIFQTSHSAPSTHPYSYNPAHQPNPHLSMHRPHTCNFARHRPQTLTNLANQHLQTASSNLFMLQPETPSSAMQNSQQTRPCIDQPPSSAHHLQHMPTSTHPTGSENAPMFSINNVEQTSTALTTTSHSHLSNTDVD